MSESKDNTILKKSPLIIIGAARSGTTILGDILALHPDVAYWLEPKYIWRYGKPLARADYRSRDEATKNVRHYIRKRFSDFLHRSGKKQFVEKTPSNVFRIDFIDEIFPEASFIHIVRDGREVSLSAEKKWTRRPEGSALIRRLKGFEIPMKDLPFYAFDVIRDVVGRTLLPGRGFVWGPWFEGITEYRSSHSVIETCAMQWVKSMEAVRESFKSISTDRILTIRYENLLENPEVEIGSLLTFAGLDTSKLEEQLKLLDKKSSRDYSREEKKKLETIYPIIKNEMKALGYL